MADKDKEEPKAETPKAADPAPKKRYRVNTGIDYVVSDADDERVKASFADKDESKRIDPFDPDNNIKMKRIDAGKVVTDLPERVVASLAKTKVVVDGELRPAIEDEDERIARAEKRAAREARNG